jgi:5-methylcytosine-specific restriction endonuclease McrA
MKKVDDFNLWDVIYPPSRKDGKRVHQDKLVHHELLAKMCIMITDRFSDQTTTRAGDILSYYNANEDVADFAKDEIKLVLKQFSLLKKAIYNKNVNNPEYDIKKLDVRWEGFTTTGGKSTFQAFFTTLWALNRKGYHVATESQAIDFLTSWQAIHNTFKTVAGKLKREEDEKSYSEWLVSNNVISTWQKVLKTWSDVLDRDIPELETEDVITPLPKARTSKDKFSFDDMVWAWHAQGGEERDGEKISYSDMYTNRSGFHADHVKSIRDNGKTTRENLEVARAEKNLKKGADSYDEPHRHAGFDREDDE